jgi:hypothetical protein
MSAIIITVLFMIRVALPISILVLLGNLLNRNRCELKKVS